MQLLPLVTFLLSCAAASAAPPQLERSRAGVPPEGTAEGVEILRRILVEALNETAPDQHGSAQRFGYRMRLFENLKDDHLVTGLWAADQDVTHSRGFHVPGAGVFFALDVRVPLVHAEPTPIDGQGDGEEDDEWERIKSEVRRGTSAGTGLVDGRAIQVWKGPEEHGTLTLDRDAIRRIEDAVLRTLARHASRVEGLASGDAITVALHLSGSGSLPVVLGQPDTDEDSEELESYQAWAFLAGGETPERHLVIRVSFADLAGSGESGLERLRQRALIHEY
jgi:hypothetical protein